MTGETPQLWKLQFRDLDNGGDWKDWNAQTYRQQEADTLKKSAQVAAVRDGLAYDFRTVQA